MDFSRRGFLNLLGVGGVGLALEARPPIALFGSEDVPDVVRPDLNLVSGHYVVYPKQFIERVPASEIGAKLHPLGYQVVGRLARNREPVKPLLRRTGAFQITPRVREKIEDSHTEFYLAAREMREQFALFSRETLLSVDAALRPGASLVTIVDAPIHARPRGLREDAGGVYEQDTDRSVGFDAVAHFRQFVVYGTAEVETFRQYSSMGEYPMQIPKDIDMGLLIHMDRKVMLENAVAPDRVTDILRRVLRLK